MPYRHFARTDRAPATDPERGERETTALNTEQLADRIISINPTATREFLGQFGQGPLRDYLDHLLSAQQPRGPESRWVRPSTTRAIVSAAR